MTAPELSYVALVVDEPETSAAIFEKDFGLPREDFSAGDRNVPASVGRSAWPSSARTILSWRRHP